LLDLLTDRFRYIINCWRFDWLCSYNNLGWLKFTEEEEYYNPIVKPRAKSEIVIVEFKTVPFDCVFRYHKKWWKKVSAASAIEVSEEIVKIPMEDNFYVATFAKNVPSLTGKMKFQV
jgi:hypothetical protein